MMRKTHGGGSWGKGRSGGRSCASYFPFAFSTSLLNESLAEANFENMCASMYVYCNCVLLLQVHNSSKAVLHMSGFFMKMSH